MSNAVTSLTAAIVQSDLKQKSPANSPTPNKLSLILTASSLSSSSSNSEVNSSEEQLNHSMTSNNTTSNSKSVDSQNTTSSSPTSSVTTPNNKSSHSKTNYYHPNHQQQHPHYINSHGIPMNLNYQAPTINGNGLQYIHLSSNSNSINNGSPMSSSPSTGSTSIQYIAHQQPHLSKHHHPNSYPSHQGGNPPTIIHGGPPPYQPQPQQQQFQQLQQFHSQFQSNYKDTRWLTLEVCREFQRNKCNRNETECKFAHPPPHVEIINGKVIACYDSLKGKCTRKEPACKYLHPPQHLKDQLLQNGKNNLVLRQVALAMMQQQPPNVQTNPDTTAALLAAATRSTPLSQYATFTATSPTNTTSSNSSSGNPQFMPSLANGGLAYQQVQLGSNGQPQLLQMLPHPSGYSHPNQHQLVHNLHMQQQSNLYANDPNSNLLQVTQNSTISPPSSVNNANSILPPQQRTDRLQICKDFQKSSCKKEAADCEHAHPPSTCPVDQENSLVIVCVDFIKGKCSRETCKYFHPPEHLVAQLKKLKIANNAMTAAAFATGNLAPSLSHARSLSSMQHTQLGNSYSPYRLQRQIDPTNNLQLLQLTQQQQQILQQRQQYSNVSQYLMNRFSLENNNNSFENINNNACLRAASYLNSSQVANSNNKSTIPASFASSARSAIDNSQQYGDLNESNGAVFTLENGQYQLPQYQVYTPMFQRTGNNPTSEEASSQIDSSNANNSSATSTTANNNGVENNGASKKRQHDTLEQDFNQMNGNIYSVKRAALTDIKTGMPVFQPLGQNSMHQLPGPQTGVSMHQLYTAQSQQAQQIALTQQIAALNYPTAYNISQMQYAPYPATFSLPYNGQPTSMPRL